MFSQNLSKTSGICEAWSAMLTAEWQYLIDANICQHSTTNVLYGEYVWSLRGLVSNAYNKLTISDWCKYMSAINNSKIWRIRSSKSRRLSQQCLQQDENLWMMQIYVSTQQFKYMEYTRLGQQCLQQDYRITDCCIFISTFKKAIIWKFELGMAVVPPKTLIQC